MNEYMEIIKTCPLFRDITDDDLGSMLACLGAKTERFDKRYTIIAEGSPAKYIGIVLSGSVSVEQTDIYGNRSILSVGFYLQRGSSPSRRTGYRSWNLRRSRYHRVSLQP